MTRPAPHDPSVRDVSTPRGNGCLSGAFFALFFLAGSLVFGSIFLKPIVYVIRAASWPAVPCIINTSRIDAIKGKPDTFHLEIKYHYDYEGVRRKSDRIWFVRSAGDDQADVQTLAGRFPEGAARLCYVDPADPEFAVLDHSFKPELLLSLLPLALAVAGLVGLLHRIRRLLFHSSQPYRLSRPNDRRTYHTYPAGTAASPGAVAFKSRRGFTALIFVAVFTAIWNGAIYFLVLEVISNWESGIPGCYGLSLTAFTIPFVLAGLALVFVTLYLLLRLFNPRPTVTLSSTRVAPGGAIEIQWQFRGQTSRIRRLCIFVEGREEATYSHGTTTTTDREVFATLRLLDTTRPAEIAAGQIQFTVPDTVIPTFSAQHNRIAWVIRIHAEIPHWPDIQEEYELTITPTP